MSTGISSISCFFYPRVDPTLSHCKANNIGNVQLLTGPSSVVMLKKKETDLDRLVIETSLGLSNFAIYKDMKIVGEKSQNSFQEMYQGKEEQRV